MQHAKRELNKKRYKTGNKNGLNLYSQKTNKQKKTWTQWQCTWSGGEGNKIGWPYARISKSEGNKESPKNMREREMGNYIHSYVHYTVCNYARWLVPSYGTQYWTPPIWTASTSVWNRMHTHKLDLQKTATFKTGHMDGAATLSNYSLKWE